jgi:salicylate hydroxylase
MNIADPIVVGGGIGGLTAALSLARRGFDVTVMEQRTSLTEPGAGIQLSPNASRVLVDLGLGRAVSRRAVEPDLLAVHRLGSGRRLAEMPLGRAMRSRYGAPYWVVLRADLHTVLLDAVRSAPNIRLRIGKKVLQVDEGPDGTDVTIAGDRDQEVIRTGLVVGADGLWSTIRASIAPAAPRFRGYVAWRATLAQSDVPAALQANETRLWLGRDAHVVHYPVASGKELNVVIVVAAEEPAGGWPASGDAAQLLRKLRGAAPPLRKLIEAAPDWRLWPLHDLDALPRWSGRNTVLIGDAAHPVLPFLAQGGALAIEDAATLTAELARNDTTLPAALAAFEKMRKPRATRVQNAARSNGRIYHLPWPLALARDTVLRRMGPERFAARYEWLYGWRAS